MVASTSAKSPEIASKQAFMATGAPGEKLRGHPRVTKKKIFVTTSEMKPIEM